ncbi:DUF6624 domain-containing protein [Flavobacterium sp.]|uniref:DUF6624 domain-containing protein n=1 Tax=Flavobacterium sp. TaxID=239 RepID=UPI00286E5636|nr:DUF6624 domain-containing protein [Flavobacterium sp.]
MKKTVLFLVLCSLYISCKSRMVYTDEIKVNLAIMFKQDQKLQTFDEKRFADKNYIDSMRFEQDKLIRKNCDVAKKYLKKYAFPGLKENGKDACTNFWLIVQHSDHNVVFQEEVLNAMAIQYKRKNVITQNYAYLHDRVLKNKGEKLLYGTQVEWSTGKPLPLPLQYPDKVEEMRKSMGLVPLKDYLDSYTKNN